MTSEKINQEAAQTIAFKKIAGKCAIVPSINEDSFYSWRLVSQQSSTNAGSLPLVVDPLRILRIYASTSSLDGGLSAEPCGRIHPMPSSKGDQSLMVVEFARVGPNFGLMGEAGWDIVTAFSDASSAWN